MNKAGAASLQTPGSVRARDKSAPTVLFLIKPPRLNRRWGRIALIGAAVIAGVAFALSRFAGPVPVETVTVTSLRDVAVITACIHPDHGASAAVAAAAGLMNQPMSAEIP